MSEQREAKVVHVVEDGGHFGISYCGNCNEELTSSSSQKVIPDTCPGCDATFSGSSDVVDFGGSDF